MTEREKAVAEASDAAVLNFLLSAIPSRSVSPLAFTRAVLKITDAARAFDAQRPAANPAPSPVAVVREAMERIKAVRESGGYNEAGAIYEAGAWTASTDGPEDHALATILNALPALIELAERNAAPKIIYSKDAGQSYRDGVTKGLEMAAAHDAIRADDLHTKDANGNHSRISALRTSARDHTNVASSIRSGGPITETGGTPNERPAGERFPPEMKVG
jgi:hypothetical protein